MMSQQYPSHQAPAAYEHSNLQSPAALSRPPSNGLPQQTFSSAQTLPPIVSGNYGPTNQMQVYTPRHPAMMTMASQAEAVNQASLSNSHFAPIYAPTSNTYFNINYNSTNGSYEHASQSQPEAEPLRPPPTYMQAHPQAQPAFTATTRSLPEIAPMPPRMNGARLPIYAGNDNPHLEEQPPPSHVVGAQGRRGILPCTGGRPAAPTGGDVQLSKNIPLPPRDEDGKYPCPHCDKTYLHSKHLKRHLLRRMFISLSRTFLAKQDVDTGVRPYSCGLCTDTFSRSDILKRHFQKCSSRRGNPTGQNHLAHSRANRKNLKKADNDSMDSGTPTIPDIPSHPQLPNYIPTSSDTSFDMNNLSLNQQNYGEHSRQVSRANSVAGSGESSGSQSNRASLGMLNTPVYEQAPFPHSAGHDTPDSITTSGAATPYTFQHESRTIQLPSNEQFHQPANGDLGFGASSRPPTSSNYSHGPLPRIVGQGNPRSYNTEWPPYQYNSHDEYGYGQHHSGTNTPLEREKQNDDYPMAFPNYTPYPGSKA